MNFRQQTWLVIAGPYIGQKFCQPITVAFPGWISVLLTDGSGDVARRDVRIEFLERETQ